MSPKDVQKMHLSHYHLMTKARDDKDTYAQLKLIPPPFDKDMYVQLSCSAHEM